MSEAAGNPTPDGDSPPRDAPAPKKRGDLAGWIASLVLHAATLALLAAATLPELPQVLGPLLVAEPAVEESIDDATLLEDTPLTLDESVSLLDTSLPTITPESAAAAGPAVELAPTSLALAPSTLLAPIPTGAAGLGLDGVDGRGEAAKGKLLRSKGGTAASERAVAQALRWIVNHQNADGTWSLDHTGGECRGRCGNPSNLSEPDKVRERTRRSGTALALLPLLGAGQTQQRGRYKRNVLRGIDALVRLAKPNEDGPGASWTDLGTMYSHGLAAIALTEAYGMTGDDRLRAPAQAAIDFIAYAQDPEGGGWRYRPRQAGDTSVTGWQVMALKSATLAELTTQSYTARSTRRFFDSVSERSGGSRYRYMPADPDDDKPSLGSRPMTAVGTLCRMYLGWDADDERLKDGIEWIAQRGPSERDYYFNYYAAQSLFHYTGGEGPTWRRWNEAMRDQLVEQQERRGHQRGSWWIDENHNRRGGRLYTTSLATMTLEVYYRYLPIYQSAAIEREFPD